MSAMRLLGLPWRLLNSLRRTIGNVLLLFLLSVFALTYCASKTEPTQLNSAHWLSITVGDSLVEQASQLDPVAELMNLTGSDFVETLVHELSRSIDLAAQDDNIAGIILNTEAMSSTELSHVVQVNEALMRFRQTGKPIVATNESYTQAQYLLASAASDVLIHPMGGVELVGFSNYQPYFNQLLEKYAIDVHVFRVGDYKAAVEPFLLNGMSDAARENTASWLQAQWQLAADSIEKNRQLPAGSIDVFINQQANLLATHKNSAAEMAKAAGLVNDIIRREQLDSWLDKKIQRSLPAIDAETYLARTKQTNRSAQIAVLQLSGEIVDGEQLPGTIGAETVREQIQTVLDNKQLQAVVVRIDSPGGSAFASDIIRDGLQQLRDDGRKVIVSMGATAASGGYWIATGGEYIFAEPTTITGSIGVFGLLPDLSQALPALGIHADGLSTHRLAELGNVLTPLDEQNKLVVQRSVEFVYQQFLQHTAEVTKLPITQLIPLAGGRIWTGAQAKQHGLVHELGNLQRALDYAANQAGLSLSADWSNVQFIAPTPSFWQQLAVEMRSVKSAVARVFVPQHLQPLLELNRSVHQILSAKRGVLAHCNDCEMQIH